MSQKYSFEIYSDMDMKNIKKAIVQALGEMVTRPEFDGVESDIDLNEERKILTLTSSGEGRLHILYDILLGKLLKYGINSKSFVEIHRENLTGETRRIAYAIVDAIGEEEAACIVREIDRLGNVRLSTHGDKMRVTGDSPDDLQAAVARLKPCCFNRPISCGNYR